MKTLKNHLKLILLLLSITLLVQSCKVYQSTPVSIEEAIQTSKKVKIKTDNNVFKFNALLDNEDKLFGIAKKGSKTAKLLSAKITESGLDNNMVKINLKKEQVKDVYLLNQELSVILTIISIPVGFIIVFVLASVTGVGT